MEVMNIYFNFYLYHYTTNFLFKITGSYIRLYQGKYQYDFLNWKTTTSSLSGLNERMLKSLINIDNNKGKRAGLGKKKILHVA